MLYFTKKFLLINSSVDPDPVQRSVASELGSALFAYALKAGFQSKKKG